jgi:hypothetical protein
MYVTGPDHVLTPGETFTVELRQVTSIPVIGAQTEFSFDPRLFELLEVTPGAPYNSGVVTLGQGPEWGPAAIAAANRSGAILLTASLVKNPGAVVASGEQMFAQLTLRARSQYRGSALVEPTRLKFVRPPLAGEDCGAELSDALGHGQGVGIGGTAPPLSGPYAAPSPMASSPTATEPTICAP